MKQWESLGFKENEKDNSVYAKFKNGKFIFHIMWIDGILLTSNDVNLSLEKKFCPQVSMWMILVKRHWFEESKFTEIEENGVLGLLQRHA